MIQRRSLPPGEVNRPTEAWLARKKFLYILKAGPAGGLRPPSAGRELADHDS
jgi:hypothetical protein